MMRSKSRRPAGLVLLPLILAAVVSLLCILPPVQAKKRAVDSGVGVDDAAGNGENANADANRRPTHRRGPAPVYSPHSKKVEVGHNPSSGKKEKEDGHYNNGADLPSHAPQVGGRTPEETARDAKILADLLKKEREEALRKISHGDNPDLVRALQEASKYTDEELDERMREMLSTEGVPPEMLELFVDEWRRKNKEEVREYKRNEALAGMLEEASAEAEAGAGTEEEPSGDKFGEKDEKKKEDSDAADADEPVRVVTDEEYHAERNIVYTDPLAFAIKKMYAIEKEFQEKVGSSDPELERQIQEMIIDGSRDIDDIYAFLLKHRREWHVRVGYEYDDELEEVVRDGNKELRNLADFIQIKLRRQEEADEDDGKLVEVIRNFLQDWEFRMASREGERILDRAIKDQQERGGGMTEEELREYTLMEQRKKTMRKDINRVHERAGTYKTKAEGTEEGGGRDGNARPTTQPASAKYDRSPTADREYAYEQVYRSIFRPQMEEYDMIKFDPYSFSGAPLGGWGRATRSRLASLPIRLVNDDDRGMGMDLLYGTVEEEESLDDDEVIDGDEESKVDESDVHTEQGEAEGSSQAGESAAEESKSGDKKALSKSKTKEVSRSTGPHFTVRDSTGQKYVCRVYAEEELVVLSRLDSVFHPAVTVWEKGSPQHASGDDKLLQDSETNQAEVQETEEGGIHIKKKFQFSINTGGAAADGENLPNGIRSSVAKMLRKMGMDDAADALAAQQRLDDIANNPEAYLGGDGNIEAEVEVDVIVAGVDGEILDGNDADAAGIADIIKAAAVGAGMTESSAKDDEKDASNEQAGSGDGKDDKKDNALKKTPHEPSTPAQLTTSEIESLLDHLSGMCSQLHLGWWSYEWCHQEQVRQFHVDVSSEPVNQKYQIQDVTMVGRYGGEMSIIYPKGVYGGKWVLGSTTSIKYNRKGNIAEMTTSRHGPIEDARYYSTHNTPLSSSPDQRKKAVEMEQRKKLGHGGPIVQQVFEDGGFCEEAGKNRKMNVELRCCTEQEIDHWLESKTRQSSRNNNGDNYSGKKKETPKAVLVSVQEDETCVYRSRVCTPVLCPKPVVIDETVEDDRKEKLRERQKTDPIGALLHAIFGEHMGEEVGQVQVYFPDDVTGQDFENLMRDAEAGIDFEDSPNFRRVRDALRKARAGGKDVSKKLNVKDLFTGDENEGAGILGSRSTSVMDVKEGESIREILDKTLGQRPCLTKNLGWWTYEFCHGKQIRQYHVNNLIDANTGFTKQKIETEHTLGVYEGSGNSVRDYPNEDEHKHVVNATGVGGSDLGIGKRKGAARVQSAGGKGDKQPGGNGAVYVQEYHHGDVCDHEDVAESVIKGGNVVHGNVERSSMVRFSCGKRWELVDIKEDSTCHYVLDVTVPELCRHPLFQAPVTKTQVVKCLPV